MIFNILAELMFSKTRNMAESDNSVQNRAPPWSQKQYIAFTNVNSPPVGSLTCKNTGKILKIKIQGLTLSRLESVDAFAKLIKLIGFQNLGQNNIPERNINLARLFLEDLLFCTQPAVKRKQMTPFLQMPHRHDYKISVLF